MAVVHTFFSSIYHFLQLLWASILAFFTYNRGFDIKSCDIEAGIRPQTAEKEPSIGVNYNSKTATCFLIPMKDGFVEIDLNSQLASLNTRTCCHTSVEPVKSRIVDNVLKRVQDRTINVIKSVIVNPGTGTPTPCSAKIEYVNLRIIGSSNAQIRLSKQSLAELSFIQADDLDSFLVEDDGPKTFVLPRTATVRYVKSLPRHKLRAVQFALPPIEIPDVFFSHKEVKEKRRSDLFDLLDQFPTPPACVKPVLPSPVVSSAKASRFARRYCIFRRAAPEDESTSSSGSDATVLSISVSGDTLESSALETPATAVFSPSAPETFKAGEDPFIYPSHFVPQLSDEMRGSPTMISILPTVVYSQDHEPSLDAAPARLPKHFDEDDIELDQGLGEDRAEGANFGFSYQQVRSFLSTSRSDGSDTTLDQLRAQLEEPTFDESIKRPQTLVWFTDHSPTKHLNNNKARMCVASDPGAGRGSGQENSVSVFPKNVYGNDYLEGALKVIREIEVDDLNFRDLFYRDSSFCRSSLANGINYRTDEATGRGSLKHFNESTEKSIQEILAILNLPDPVQVAAEDSSWEFCSEEMGTDILSLAEIAPAFSIANTLQRGGLEDLFTWMAMDSDVDEDRKEELFSEDEDDQWHDAVLDLDAL